MGMKWPDDFIGRVIQGDCLEVMKQMPDKCVDLVLTDFPYGVLESYDSYEDTWEHLLVLISLAMPEIIRISKRALITTGVKAMRTYPPSDWHLAWVTPAGTGCGPWGFCTWQPILAFGKDPHLENGLGSKPDSFIHTESSEKDTGHPCPKPLTLWKKVLLRGSVKESDIVFDPFLGSGTTALAAMELGRKWSGVELSEKYCAISRKRIKNEMAQGKLL